MLDIILLDIRTVFWKRLNSINRNALPCSRWMNIYPLRPIPNLRYHLKLTSVKLQLHALFNDILKQFKKSFQTNCSN